MTEPDPPQVFLYAAGACSGNPGPGGWCALVVDPETGLRAELSGSDPDTTNNRMELTAVIEGLRSIPRPSRVRITTDSRYVVDGMREWLPRWMRNGWRTSDRKPVKNRDLWEELTRLQVRHTLEFHWIRGHDGHPENERCDEVAVEAYQKYLR